MPSRKERNCTHMEFINCYVEDPTMDRKSTREFRRTNERSRQCTRSNAMSYGHQSAYPRALCDHRPSSPDDNASLFRAALQSRPFTPKAGLTLKQIGKTTKQVDHDKKTPIATAPITEEELLQRTFLTAENRAEFRELKRVPYDAISKVALGHNNSLYRTDFGGDSADMEHYGAFKLPRVQFAPVEGTAASDGTHFRNKQEKRSASAHLSELEDVQRASVRRATTPRRPLVEGLPVNFDFHSEEAAEWSKQGGANAPRRPDTARTPSSRSLNIKTSSKAATPRNSRPPSSPHTPRALPSASASTPVVDEKEATGSDHLPTPPPREVTEPPKRPRRYLNLTQSYFNMRGGFEPYKAPPPVLPGCSDGRKG